MATLQFDRVNRLIIVLSPDTEVSVQELYDKSADYLDEPAQMDLANFVQAAGKFNLGGGEFTGVALRLLNWKVQFEDRAGPGITQCSVTGGDLIAVDAIGDPTNAIEPSTNVFAVIRQSTAPAAIQPVLSQDDLDNVGDAVWAEDSTQAFPADSMGDFVAGGGLAQSIFNKLFGPLFTK